MILRSWADRLLQVSEPSEAIDLHVRDVAAAFCTGLHTNDGRAIVRRHDGNRDRAELAATVSALARLSECDDIHLASCVTPGALVFPVALALSGGDSAGAFNRAVSVGYAVGTGIGSAIGGARVLAHGLWPTLFVAPVMAAATASLLVSGDPDRLAHAIALALAEANGRVADLRERWTSLADAVSRGVRASEAAHRGERGDLSRMPRDIDVDALAANVSIATVGFKPFPIARQGANAVVALQSLLANGLDPHRIESIEVFVPSVIVALLNRPASESDRLSRLCNMGVQLAAAALHPDLLYDPERLLRLDVLELASRVTVTAASDLEDMWPHRWAARVVVHAGGDRLDETVTQAPFDHDAPNLPQFLQEKWRRMLPAQDLTLLNLAQPGGAPYATLWQQIERRLKTPVED